jgi:hypothetical protein
MKVGGVMPVGLLSDMGLIPVRSHGLYTPHLNSCKIKINKLGQKHVKYK